MNQSMNMVSNLMHRKATWITLGAVGGAAALMLGAISVWNSKQMRTARVIKRTERILYQLGTAMRNLSGLDEGCV